MMEPDTEVSKPEDRKRQFSVYDSDPSQVFIKRLRSGSGSEGSQEENQVRAITIFDEAIKQYQDNFATEDTALDFLIVNGSSDQVAQFLKLLRDQRGKERHGKFNWLYEGSGQHNELSEKIMRSIFKHLDVVDLKVSRLVCMFWCKVATPILDARTTLNGGLPRLAGSPPGLRGCDFLPLASTRVWRTHCFRHIELSLMKGYWQGGGIEKTLNSLFMSSSMCTAETLKITGYRVDLFDHTYVTSIPACLGKFWKKLKSITFLKPYPLYQKMPLQQYAEWVPDGIAALEKIHFEIDSDKQIDWKFLDFCSNLKVVKIQSSSFIPRGYFNGSKIVPPMRRCLKQIRPQLEGKSVEQISLGFSYKDDVEAIINFVNSMSSTGTLKKVTYRMDKNKRDWLKLINSVSHPLESANFIVPIRHLYNFIPEICEAMFNKGYLELETFSFRCFPWNIRKVGKALFLSNDVFHHDEYFEHKTDHLGDGGNKSFILYYSTTFPANGDGLEDVYTETSREHKVFERSDQELKTHVDWMMKTLVEETMAMRKLFDDKRACIRTSSDANSPTQSGAVIAMEQELASEKLVKESGPWKTSSEIQQSKDANKEAREEKAVATLFDGNQSQNGTCAELGVPSKQKNQVIDSNYVTSLEVASQFCNAVTEYISHFDSDQQAISRLIQMNHSVWPNINTFVSSVWISSLYDREDWRTNPIVLDAICERLSTANLKSMRSVCKKWLSVASSSLTKRTICTEGNDFYEPVRHRERGVHFQKSTRSTAHPSLDTSRFSSIRLRHLEINARGLNWEENLEMIKNSLFMNPTMSALETLRIWSFHPQVMDQLFLPHYIPMYLKELKSLTLALPISSEPKKFENVELCCEMRKLEKLVVNIHGNWEPSWDFLEFCPKLKCFKLLGRNLLPSPLRSRTYEAVAPGNFVKCLQDIWPYLETKSIQKLGLKFCEAQDVSQIADFVKKVADKGTLKEVSYEVDAIAAQVAEMINLFPLPSQKAKIVIDITPSYNRQQRPVPRIPDFVNTVLDQVAANGYLKLDRLDCRIVSYSARTTSISKIKAALLSAGNSVVFRVPASGSIESRIQLPANIQERLSAWFPTLNYVCRPIQVTRKSGSTVTKLLERVSAQGTAFYLPALASIDFYQMFKELATDRMTRMIVPPYIQDAKPIHRNALNVPTVIRNRDLYSYNCHLFIFSRVEVEEFEEAKRDPKFEKMDISHWQTADNLTMVRTFINNENNTA